VDIRESLLLNFLSSRLAGLYQPLPKLSTKGQLDKPPPGW
jgi:hypothetical protein